MGKIWFPVCNMTVMGGNGGNLFRFNLYIVLEAMCRAFLNRQSNTQGMLLPIKKLIMKTLLWNGCFLRQVLAMPGIVRVRRNVMAIL